MVANINKCQLGILIWRVCFIWKLGLFLCLISNNTYYYFPIIYNLSSWLALEHGKTQSFLDMTKFLQQSLAIFLQSPVHLSSGVPYSCFLQWHPHSHPNKDGEKSSQKFNFPTTQPCSIFPLIIMRKSGRRGAWINGKEVYQCSVDGSFQANQKRKDTFWLAYCLGFIFSKTQISEQPYHFLYYLEVDIIITTIGQVWVDKKCFKF